MKGQIVLEVLIALTIAVIIITAITTVVLSSLNSSLASKNQATASRYAQEGIEIMRSVSGVAMGTTWCLGKEKTALEADCSAPNIDGIFLRKIYIESNPGNCGALQQVRISVRWNSSKCQGTALCEEVPLVSCMSV